MLKLIKNIFRRSYREARYAAREARYAARWRPTVQRRIYHYPGLRGEVSR